MTVPLESAAVPAAGNTAAELAERLLAGDKRALARAISLVENDDPEGWALVREVYPKTGRASIVGFTGPPGVGKSTLIGRLVELARAKERQVAVLSIDPSSPFTQGALLGDRIRLTDHFLDPGVYIRSMASRGSLGGLSEATLQAALLMDASGKDDRLLGLSGPLRQLNPEVGAVAPGRSTTPRYFRSRRRQYFRYWRYFRYFRSSRVQYAPRSSCPVTVRYCAAPKSTASWTTRPAAGIAYPQWTRSVRKAGRSRCSRWGSRHPAR